MFILYQPVCRQAAKQLIDGCQVNNSHPRTESSNVEEQLKQHDQCVQDDQHDNDIMEVVAVEHPLKTTSPAGGIKINV